MINVIIIYVIINLLFFIGIFKVLKFLCVVMYLKGVFDFSMCNMFGFF